MGSNINGSIIAGSLFKSAGIGKLSDKSGDNKSGDNKSGGKHGGKPSGETSGNPRGVFDDINSIDAGTASRTVAQGIVAGKVVQSTGRFAVKAGKGIAKPVKNAWDTFNDYRKFAKQKKIDMHQNRINFAKKRLNNLPANSPMAQKYRGIYKKSRRAMDALNKGGSMAIKGRAIRMSMAKFGRGV